MADINYDDYTKLAVEKANAYVEANIATGKLNGKDAAETADIAKFLKTNPYDTEKMHGTVKKMLQDATKNAKPAPKGERSIIYLSGATGAKGLLMAAAEGKENQDPQVVALREALKVAVKSDFATHKKQFSKYSGVDIIKEPYGKWRGLLSGVDQSLADIVRTENLDFVVDNTMAPVDAATEKMVQAEVEKDKKSGKLNLFAVALSTEEAVAEAKKLNIPEHDAVQTAKDFNAFFEKIKQDVPDITLFDKDMNVIYQQKDGKEVKLDKEKMEAWDKGFKTGGGEQLSVDDLGALSPDVKGLPQPPRRIGG